MAAPLARASPAPYESETKELNQYEAGKGLVIRFGNKRFEFDPAQDCKIRFRKSDGTYADAASYPFIKGNTVVAMAPAGLTRTVHLEATALINQA
ncbi:MAG TPA: hypothetical protein PKZ97_19900, partial [Azospirillaceae bacterium]|nr:hypothetical protein [Azospirillaceae bacterium]